MAYLPNQQFKELATKIHKEGKASVITPKQLLSYFNVASRRSHVIWWIDRALSESELITIPSYKTGWVHAKMELTTEKIISKKKNKAPEEDEIVVRVKILDAANTQPTSISKNDSIEKAMTIMMENDFSQLPVMNAPKSTEVDGMISWHSIGWKNAIKKDKRTVGDFMNRNCTIIRDDTPLLEAVEIVKEKEVVLIRQKDKAICGLVTIADIADKFYSLAEPFFIIGQIEASIREIIDNKFTEEELAAIKFGDDKREIKSVSDLTFNEYIELMRKENNWEKLVLPLDKNEFTARLVEIRDIRNDVMHFNADNIEDEQKRVLRKTALFLKEILN
jgi:predicted transcriptional regulator